MLDSGDIQEAAARLRIAELESVQSQVELELSNIAALAHERTAEGASSHVTALLRNRLTARKKKVRALMAMWVAWHSFEQPQLDPPTVDEEHLFAGALPWQPASHASAGIRDSYQLSAHKLSSELARCREELKFLPGDALNVIRMYHYQRHLVEHAISEMPAQPRLPDTGPQQQPGAEVHVSESMQPEESDGQSLKRIGKLFLLRAHASRIAALESQARACFEAADLLQPN